VQTFLPYADFAASAAALDDLRLGKQRVEALQVLRALTRETYGWKNHPAVRQWIGYEEALASYGVAICAEWVARGRADTCAATMAEDLAIAGLPPARPQGELRAEGRLPPWLGDERLHRSHQASLLRKNPEHYSSRFPDADPELPYFWPSKHYPPGPTTPQGSDHAVLGPPGTA
jgi:Pyrimidine dimer DNA glycosylase